jgi:gliding motility-associated lipoprotein GldD
MKSNIIILTGLFFLASINGCTSYTPKPKAYPRVIYPEKKYENTQVNCPFVFEKPIYSTMNPYADKNQPCWYNLYFPTFDATLHLSYIPINSVKALDSLAEDAYRMVFKPHLQRAEEIIEKELSDSAKGLSGMIYDLEGRTATPFNFYLTDRKKHFIRGAFYFNKKTDIDSVQPIYEFINKDIIHILETFSFK